MEAQSKKPVYKESGLAERENGTLLSVIIVSYNVSGYLDHCLDVVNRACAGFSHEIIIIDNTSTDNTVEMVREKYPQVVLVENPRNLGYSRANNQGIEIAKGRFVLFLNPDTIVPAKAFQISMDFLEAHKDAGAVSLKLVNADGSFQPACRRGFPTPSTAFYRMTGLSWLFPGSKRFGRYNMTFLDENETNEVDAVCGAYLMVKSSVLNKVGGFDETFFMYGEDIDLCFRIKKNGYKVYYCPESEIIHFKGKSSSKNRISSALNFYNSMLIFSKKYFSQRMSFFPRGILFAGILLNAILKIIAGWCYKVLPHFIDIVLVNGTLFIALLLKFGYHNLYHPEEGVWYLLLHLSITLSFLVALNVNGIYSGTPRKAGDFIKAVFIASLIFFSFAYFIPNVRFSRLAFIATCAVLFILIPGWRWLFPMTANWLNTAIAKKNRVVIVGTGQMANQVYDKLFSISAYRSNFKGFIAESDHIPSINKMMIIGHIKDIKNIVKTVKINEIIVAASEKSDFDFMGLINYCTKNNIILKMVQGMHEDGKYCILDVNMSETVVI